MPVEQYEVDLFFYHDFFGFLSDVGHEFQTTN